MKVVKDARELEAERDRLILDVRRAEEAFNKVIAETVAERDRLLEDIPSLDEVEAVGFDGSLRGLDGRPVGQPVTWKELAQRLRKLLAKCGYCGAETTLVGQEPEE